MVNTEKKDGSIFGNLAESIVGDKIFLIVKIGAVDDPSIVKILVRGEIGEFLNFSIHPESALEGGEVGAGKPSRHFLSIGAHAIHGTGKVTVIGSRSHRKMMPCEILDSEICRIAVNASINDFSIVGNTVRLRIRPGRHRNLAPLIIDHFLGSVGYEFTGG